MTLEVVGGLDGCFNDCEPIQVLVKVENVVPADQPVVGGQFFLQWNPACFEIVDIVPAFGGEVGRLIDNAAGIANYGVVSFDPQIGDTDLAIITIQPKCNWAEFACDPELRFRPKGPSGLLNKVSIPGGAIEHDPDWATTPDPNDPYLELDPALGSSLDLRWDIQAPVVTCPDDMSVPMDPGECHACVDPGQATAVDNVDGPIPSDQITCTRSDGLDCVLDCYPEGCTTLTWCATDECGNTGCCEQEICVYDNQPPTITCPPDQLDVPADPGACEATNVDTGYATCEDNCSCDVTYCRSDLLDLNDPYPVGCTTITWYAIDNENIATCVQTICVIDEEAPTCVIPDDINTNAMSGECYALVELPEPDCDDNCGVDEVSCTRSDGLPLADPYPVGCTTITCVASDESADSPDFTYTYQVCVNDGECPEMSCPPDIDENNDDGQCEKCFVAPKPTCTDNCGCEVTCIRLDTGEEIDGVTAQCFDVGDTIIQCTATDGICEVQCQYTITIRDNQAPTCEIPPDINVPVDDGECYATVVLPDPVCDDNCGVDEVTCTRSDGLALGDPYPVGCTTITCVASDGSPDSADFTYTYQVCVIDDEDPVINGCPPVPPITVNNDPGLCSAIVIQPEMTPSDNCDIESFECNWPPDNKFLVGETEVCCTAEDVNGNATTCCFTVEVLDTEKPSMTDPVPNPVIAYADLGQCEAIVPREDIGEPICDDNCDPCSGCNPMATRSDSTPSNPKDLDDPFPVGDTIITWLCIDGSGNTRRKTQTVTVLHGFTANVEFTDPQFHGQNPNSPRPVIRPITFELFDCASGARVEYCVDMGFDKETWNDLAEPLKTGTVFVEVPISILPFCGIEFTCITARDKLHTLRRTIDGGDEGQPLAQPVEVHFTNANGKALRAGNFNDDCWVDVEDFGIIYPQLVAENQEDKYMGPADCTTVPFHTDLSGDGYVDWWDLLDLKLWTQSFWGVSEPNCCGLPPACEFDLPKTSIAVSELQAKGVINAHLADLNQNGFVDLDDVRIFLGGQGLQLPPEVLQYETPAQEFPGEVQKAPETRRRN
jgi:hypothetical protein